MDPFKALRVNAAMAVMRPDRAAFLRHVFRYYSSKFHTPLWQVEELPLDHVLTAYWEQTMSDLKDSYKDGEKAFRDTVAELVETVDVDGIHAARRFVKATLAERLADRFSARYRELASRGPYEKSPPAMARRSLRNACLSYLLETPAGEALAVAQLAASDNMTDTLAALGGMVLAGASAAPAALAEFESAWRDDPLVMDKWFAIQASAPGAATVGRVAELMQHPAFSLRNPNKVRAVLGAFAMSNPTAFHAADGSGYRLLADRVIELDALNPQIAARMVSAFNPWTRYDENRRRRAKGELQRMAAAPGLSGEVAEIVGNALGMEQMENR